MPSSYTDNLRLEQQGQGENANTWGIRLNQTISAIDQAIAGSVEVAVGTGTTVLTALNNDDDESRNKTLRLTGSLSGSVIVEVPANEKEYVVWDTTTRNGNTIEMRLGGAGSTATVTAGRVSHFVTDGASWAEAVPLGTGDDDVRTNSENDARFLQESNDLSDLDSASTARSNLGLGSAAVEADNRYAHRSNNLSDLGDAGTSRSNLGLGSAAVQPDGRYAHRANNLSDLGSAPTARTNLGLGSMAVRDVTVSTSEPSGGSDGDIWLQYST